MFDLHFAILRFSKRWREREEEEIQSEVQALEGSEDARPQRSFLATKVIQELADIIDENGDPGFKH